MPRADHARLMSEAFYPQRLRNGLRKFGIVRAPRGVHSSLRWTLPARGSPARGSPAPGSPAPDSAADGYHLEVFRSYLPIRACRKPQSVDENPRSALSATLCGSVDAFGRALRLASAARACFAARRMRSAELCGSPVRLGHALRRGRRIWPSFAASTRDEGTRAPSPRHESQGTTRRKPPRTRSETS